MGPSGSCAEQDRHFQETEGTIQSGNKVQDFPEEAQAARPQPFCQHLSYHRLRVSGKRERLPLTWHDCRVP